MREHRPLPHTRTPRRALLAALAAAALACGSTKHEQADKTDAFAVPPAQAVSGLSYGNWGAAWWQWALNIPVATSPLLDQSGASCGAGQSGPVWFLAGSFGETVVRACTVAADKYVFVPILNTFQCVDPADPYIDTPAKVFAAFDGMLRNVTMTVQLDGVAVKDPASYRARSGVFTLVLTPADADSIIQAPPGTYPDCYADGYWLMLKPLAPGAHTLRFTGAMVVPSPMSLDVTYHLTVP